MIEKYFKDYVSKYHKMKMALKRYNEAKEDFYSLSGVDYDKVNVMGGKPNEFADIMHKIDLLLKDYKEKLEDYEIEKSKCLSDIEQLKNPIYQAVLEYKYLDFNEEYKISDNLKKYNGKDYAPGSVYNLVAKAQKELLKIISEK